ncbi:MAG: class I SAM-dependent methyltransferase, partial [Gammaproteobacteria bacterium]|nr:class I SAM-dependent methyltransferase [Gammaproteobacteria bacterium]
IYKKNVVVLKNCEKAEQLAAALSLSMVTEIKPEIDLYLAYYFDQLYLCAMDGKQELKVSVDFDSAKTELRRQRIGLKSEPLLRAVGCNSKNELTVLDATAGFGRDAFLLANYHCKVTLVEESPIVAAILQDGIDRASQLNDLSNVMQQMQLVNQSSTDFLETTENNYDVIYLDPMFPPRAKSAKVKKDMQLLHRLLGRVDEALNEKLLSIARQKALKRVVVKRPKTANFLADASPSYSLNTKAMRFDVYQIA